MHKTISTILFISTALVGCGEEETTTSVTTTTSTTQTTSTTGSTTTATTATTATTTTTGTTGTTGTTATTGTTTETTGTPLSLNGDGIQEIFNNNCTSYCHSGGSASASLDLSNGNSYDEIVEVASGQGDFPIVSAGNPDRSYMMYKLLGTHEEAPANGSGKAMPKDLAPLSASDQELIAQWIADGANP